MKKLRINRELIKRLADSELARVRGGGGGGGRTVADYLPPEIRKPDDMVSRCLQTV